MSGYSGLRGTVLLLCFTGAACGGRAAPGAHVETRDSAGTRIVTHTRLEPTRSLALGSSPEVWIRGDERIPPLDRITAMAILSDGAIVIADGSANQVHAFSSDGAYRWSAGGPGDGPGEFRRINSLIVTPGDSILVVDAQLGRLTVVSAAGDVVGDRTLARQAGAPAALLSSGTLLYMNQEPVGERNVGLQHTRATWSTVDLAGTSVRTLTTTPGSDAFFGQPGGMSIVVRLDFMLRPFVVALADGFAVALSDGAQVDRYGPDGTLLLSVRAPEEALSTAIVDAQAVRDEFVDEVGEEMHGVMVELVEDVPVPDRWPPIGALIVDDLDRAWVQAFQPERGSELTWHIFSANGAYVDRVVTPRGFSPRVIRSGRVAGVWRDELDVQSVRLYRIERE